MIEDATFGAWLRRRREERGVALCDLCQRLGLAFRDLSRVEADKAPAPDAHVIRLILVALGCDAVETYEVLLLVEWERRLPALRAAVLAYPGLLLAIDRLILDAVELRAHVERVATLAPPPAAPEPPNGSARGAVAAHWLAPQKRR